MSRDKDEALAARFEEQRPRLRGVAYRMLGSLTEADDAVQEAWLRLARSQADGIDDLRAWLTTVVARVCLDVLRARRMRSQGSIDGARVPDPIVSLDEAGHPESEALLADSVGLALLVVLDTLSPAERLAFVLHDVFGVPFEEIAPVVGRSPTATRQLASRGRRRVRSAGTSPGADPGRQREVVAAFLAASRDGDFERLLAVLDPDVVLRLDRGPVPAGASMRVAGAHAVAGLGFRFSGDGWSARPAMVNGGPGVIVTRGDRAFSVIGFTLRGDRIVAIDILADPSRIPALLPTGDLGGPPRSGVVS